MKKQLKFKKIIKIPLESPKWSKPFKISKNDKNTPIIIKMTKISLLLLLLLLLLFLV